MKRAVKVGARSTWDCLRKTDLILDWFAFF